MIEFKLPSLGADMDEAKLLEWRVAPGQTVRKGDVLAIVDTSKAAVEVECWDEGTVHELRTRPGETIAVGTTMALLLAPGERVGDAPSAEAASPPLAPAAGATAGERRRISPAARKRAEEAGVDVAALGGTGPGGALTLADVERAAAARASAPQPTADRQAAMRRAIAAAMSRSKREIPHYYLSETVPLALTIEWLARTNAQRPLADRLLLAAPLLKAVAVAAREFPDMNGFWRDGAFRPAPAVHLGVAISLRQGGLIAPALHDVAAKPLERIMRELGDLVKRARAGSLRSSELSDPTLTVTNLGEQAVESVFGVIYPPQVALVGFGSPTDRPWVREGAVCVMPAITVTLSADHRASDGHRGALFLARIRDLLQRPEQL